MTDVDYVEQFLKQKLKHLETVRLSYDEDIKEAWNKWKGLDEARATLDEQISQVRRALMMEV